MMRFDNEFGQYLFTAVHVRQVQAPSIYIGVVCGCVHPGVSSLLRSLPPGPAHRQAAQHSRNSVPTTFASAAPVSAPPMPVRGCCGGARPARPSGAASASL